MTASAQAGALPGFCAVIKFPLTFTWGAQSGPPTKVAPCSVNVASMLFALPKTHSMAPAAFSSLSVNAVTSKPATNGDPSGLVQSMRP
jgi:hypothetical protein